MERVGKYTRLVCKNAYVPFSNEFHTSDYVECLSCKARMNVGWICGKVTLTQLVEEFIQEHRHRSKPRTWN